MYAKIVLGRTAALSDKLAQPQLAQLRQRLAVIAQLEPLSAPETGELHRAPAEDRRAFRCTTVSRPKPWRSLPN